ncbi:MAG: CPBP family intramembrane metalloprotease [Geothrix sp.]|uniref:CPBP family intramembrane glutamic endopeptidase n=1 Tax=Geothrix sp. TaxID=1962974 RepID=UPI0017B9B373|nr:type II CAAX endopeptidase family protein [Geothrix sp.]NWJ41198.1 CPBP family intramembrane metalloprotease [Geothrix sp.]WIL20811.1 MAG: CPBP family intramembrane metalloprotease [Geothrix sp.]
MPAWLATCFINEQGSVRSGWKALGFMVLFPALGLAFSLIAKALHVPRMGMGVVVWINAAIVALASFVCVRLEKRSFRDLGFRLGPRWLGELVAGTLGGILLILVTALIVKGLDGFHWERAAGIGPRQLLAAAWAFLGVAFFEEIMSRGFPFQRLVEGAGTWVGQLVFAALFALGHWGNPGMHGATRVWATLNIGLAAILLGFCYLRTRSLALPIGVHLGWNWAQGSLLGFGVSGTTDTPGLWTPIFHGKPEWLTGGAFGLEASLPCALVCGAFILLLWRWKGTIPSGDASTASAS